MNLLSRLLGNKDPTEKLKAPGHNRQETIEGNQALADDPVRFAGWVAHFCLRAIKAEMDLVLCPSADQCERLEITQGQREACRREFSIMRTLGACMFVGGHLPATYYEIFKTEIFAETVKILYGASTQSRITDISNVIDQYLEDLQSDSATAYLERVYSGNPNEESMFRVGLYQIPFKQAMFVFDAVRDGYCQLKFGLPFQALDALGTARGHKSE